MGLHRKKHFLLVCLTALAAAVILFASACAGPRLSNEFEPNRVPVFVGTGKNTIERAEDIRTAIGCAAKDHFEVKEDGSLLYYRVQNCHEEAPKLTDEEAIRTAKKYLSDLGLLPRSGYQATLNSVITMAVDNSGSGFSDPYIATYQVAFYRTHNGTVVVSDKDDGILVAFDALGLKDLRYYWRDLAIEKIPDNGPTLSRDKALTIFNNEWANIHGDCCEAFENPFIQQTYLQLEGVTRPCWMIAEDTSHANAVYIDMYTGEILHPSKS